MKKPIPYYVTLLAILMSLLLNMIPVFLLWEQARISIFSSFPLLCLVVALSNGFVACILSVGEGRVGIDAEPTECPYTAEKQNALAARFFSEDEQKSLSAGDKTFAQLWTRREAALKMTGEGFAKGIGQELPQNVHFTTLTIGGFTLTVAAEQTANVVVKEYMK